MWRNLLVAAVSLVVTLVVIEVVMRIGERFESKKQILNQPIGIERQYLCTYDKLLN